MTGLRICLVASSRFPVREPFAGGMEAHTHALAAALVRRGHDVALFCKPGSDPGLGVTEIPVAAFESSEVARADVGHPQERWMAEQHAYLGLLLGLAEGRHGPFDVIHNNSLHHLPVALSRLVAAPVVTTLHTPPVAWLESAAELADPRARYLAVSASVARSWSHVLDAEVVHNGVDTDAWAPIGPQETRTGGSGVRAVWSGRLVAEKAPHEAIRAARLAGVPLDLAGPAHDPAYLHREVEPLLGGDVRWHGHLGAPALRELVSRASVALVTPRWQEPFGLVAAEALACGTPVAAYDVGGLAEVVAPEVGCLAPVGDVRALATALREAAGRDRALVRRYAVARFSQDRMVDRYEEVYREVAGGVRAA